MNLELKYRKLKERDGEVLFIYIYMEELSLNLNYESNLDGFLGLLSSCNVTVFFLSLFFGLIFSMYFLWLKSKTFDAPPDQEDAQKQIL